jgi:hypothetical protein
MLSKSSIWYSIRLICREVGHKPLTNPGDQAAIGQCHLTVVLHLYHSHHYVLAQVKWDPGDDGIEKSNLSDSEIAAPGERP